MVRQQENPGPVGGEIGQGSEETVAVPGLYIFNIVLDDVPVLSQLAVLQPADVADFVDMAVFQLALEEDMDHIVFTVQPDDVDLRHQR